ncbi:MAG: Eco57I restriction-modification methylase domain-containing protein [Anaerolineae bacterium]
MDKHASNIVEQSPAHGAVYTRPWVVELILDLAGYTPDRNLVDALAVEPAVGEGAFFTQMAARLVASCQRQGRPLQDCLPALLAYESDPRSAAIAVSKTADTLIRLGVPKDLSQSLAHQWITVGNYLLESEKWLLANNGRDNQALLPPSELQADFVIGNPPYIRLEDIPTRENTLYRSMYRTMKGRADIYIAFYEAALCQLKPGGVLGFICADRWMFNQYGSALRNLITSNFNVKAIIEMHHAEAFESQVDAYPAITVISRQPQAQVILGNIKVNGQSIEPTALTGLLHSIETDDIDSVGMEGITARRTPPWFSADEPWLNISVERRLLLRRLEQDYPPLQDPITETRVGIGLATGADSVFITRDQEIVERERLLPLALTNDIRTGDLRWSNHYLINPWQNERLVDLTQYPRLKAYLDEHKPKLQKRNVAQRNPEVWFRTIDRVEEGLSARPKLYIPDIKSTIFPVLDTGVTYPHHNLYFITSGIWNLEILGAILMSDVGKFFVECYGVRMRGGYLRMQAQYLRRIHVPAPGRISEQLGEGLSRAFRERDVRAATALVLRLYEIDYIPS